MSRKQISRGDIDAKVAALFQSMIGNRTANAAVRPVDWTSDVAFLTAIRLFPERFTEAEIELRFELMNPTSPGWYVFRISLGMLLAFATGLLAIFFVKLAFDLLMFWVRCEMVALALFFALQCYAVCRILIFRRKPIRGIPGFPAPGDETGPPGGGTEPGTDPLVPASPMDSLPTLTAAAKIPQEGDPDL